MAMRLVICLALLVSAPAWAQNTIVATPAGSVEPSPLMLQRAARLARLRSRGVTLAVIGGVTLGVGLVVGSLSALLWQSGARDDNPNGFSGYYKGAIAMDSVGSGMMIGGAALLAIGCGNIEEAKRPPLFGIRFQ